MLTTRLNVSQIPKIYARFASEIGESHWKKRVALLKTEARGNPLLAPLHRRENSIAFELERLRELSSRFDSFLVAQTTDHALIEAATLAAQVLSVIDTAGAELGNQFRQRVRGAFNKPADMRAIKLELAVATHFTRAGYKLSWPEMSSSKASSQQGVPDLLIEDLGPKGVEIECKSFSEAKGRRINRRDCLDFFGLLKRRHHERLAPLHAGMVGVITLVDGLPSAYSDRVKLVDAAVNILTNKFDADRPREISDIKLFPTEPTRLRQLQSSSDRLEQRSLIDEISMTKNKEAMLQVTKDGGALLLVLQSERDDALLDSIFETLRASAQRQFSGERPAIFMTRISGLSTEDVLSLTKQDGDPSAVPTGLMMHMTKFMASGNRDHVVGVTLLSETSRGEDAHGRQESGGAVYYFSKRASPYWTQELDTVFGQFESR